MHACLSDCYLGGIPQDKVSALLGSTGRGTSISVEQTVLIERIAEP